MRTKNLLVIFVLCIGLIFNCGKKDKASINEETGVQEFPNDSQQVKDEFGVWLHEGVLCKNVVNRKPQNLLDSSDIKTDQYAKIYFYTRVGALKKTNIYHRYSILRKGLDEDLWEEVHKTDLNVKSTNYRTWSYKTLYSGKWRIDLLGPDGKSSIKSFLVNVTNDTPKKEMNFDPAYDISTISIEDSALCEDVVKNTPVNPNTEFTLPQNETSKKVWLYLKIKAATAPTYVYLRWARWIQSIDGKEGWMTFPLNKLRIGGKSWRTRGMISCQEGRWRLDIIAPDGETVMKNYEFEILPAEELQETETEEEGAQGEETL